jgi:epoxyqueuosine reductase
MKDVIRQRAGELGFDSCHFTTAKPPESQGRFQQWLESGQHGQMAYLARAAHKRADLQLVLPGAKTIIALAVSYAQVGFEPPETAERRPGTLCEKSPVYCRAGFVARYARSADYHQIIGQRLAQLTAFVDQLGHAQARSLWYVDTGPVLERDLGQRAGLGFIGKHTNLISRRLGNWVFLSEIITTVEMEPDAPEKNRCGSCARCIEACPTAAIAAPFELDARRCISYLTIELKGPVPLELRPLIGNRIFGCDDCLAACPWNRFAREGHMMKTYARPDLISPDLVSLLALDEPAFKGRFSGTPILRAKRAGFLRNVCVALGNVGDATQLAALQHSAADPDALVAEHAHWAIRQIQDREGKPQKAGSPHSAVEAVDGSLKAQ